MENLHERQRVYPTKILIVKFFILALVLISFQRKLYPRRNYRVIYRWKLNGSDRRTTFERGNRNRSFCINCLRFLRKHLIARLFSGEIKDLQETRRFIKKMSRDADSRFIKILQMMIIALYIARLSNLSRNTKDKLLRDIRTELENISYLCGINCTRCNLNSNCKFA